MDFISTDLDGAVAVVTIDHPPLNALSAALLRELEEELERLTGLANACAARTAWRA